MRNKLIVNLYKTEDKKLNHHKQKSWNLPDEMSNSKTIEFLGKISYEIYHSFWECEGEHMEFYHEHWEKNEGDFNEIKHMKVKTLDEGVDELLGYLMKLYAR